MELIIPFFFQTVSSRALVNSSKVNSDITIDNTCCFFTSLEHLFSMKINFEKKEKLILATKPIYFFPYYMCNVNMISSLYVKFLHIKLWYNSVGIK